MSSTIWIVVGSSGQYDDFRTWLVRAFVSEFDARAFAMSLTDEAEKVWESAQPGEDIPTLARDTRVMWDFYGSKAPTYCVEILQLEGAA